MDFDRQIREEVRSWTPERRAHAAREKALEHGEPELTDDAIFDTTTFGEREKLPTAHHKDLLEDTTEELNGILDLRQ